MEFESNYGIVHTAEFIHSRNFTRVALQFPDELLKDSVKVVGALREKLGEDGKDLNLFVMADTTYGSCCVDEVGASHVDAHCVIHYGHTCFSPTSNIPALFVFGKAAINASHCADSISKYARNNNKPKPIVVLFGLEYVHAMQKIKDAISLDEISSEIHFAQVKCAVMNPSKDLKSSSTNEISVYSTGGLVWSLPEGHKIKEYCLLWIGSDNAAFANVVLTFNGCDIARYDAVENCVLTDLSQQKKVLMRRYYLVEKAKDANIIGILVGTLGVAGYLYMINQMKELITKVGKKAYTLVMGKPNPAKLANFPECDVFIYVSCAQTALLDSKEYLAPIITPFEAMLAFNRGSQWTGEYVMEFRRLITSSSKLNLQGSRYVEEEEEENSDPQENGDLALLQLRHSNSIIKGKAAAAAKSGAEFLANRSYHGLEIQNNSSPQQYLLGRTGKASGYQGEKREEAL